MRAMLCACGCHLEASGYEGLVSELLDHLGLDYPEIGLGEDHVQELRKIVVACSDRLEWVDCERATPDVPKRFWATDLIGLRGGRV
jgi:hypothetical protein